MAVPQFPADLPQRSADLLFEKKLGRGYFGEVWQSRSQRDPEKVFAVKKVPLEIVRRHKMIDQMDREIDIMRKLDHPHIVKLFFDFRDDSHVYLGMEFAVGGSMFDALSKAGKFSYEVAAKYFYEVCDALNHLHNLDGKAVVHRDIKPENFLFTRRESEREPLPPQTSPLKLIDFGLSRRLGAEAGVSITQKIGTTEYMAPESFAGRMSMALADRADMWSIGVVLHIMFIGHFPSPKLAEQSTEDYLAAACWKHVSKSGLDLLGHLLRFDPNTRHGCSLALRHPWLAEHVNASAVRLTPAMPLALRSFTDGTALRRLALAACAREVDDSSLAGLRRLYQALHSQCVGALTPLALERMHGPIGSFAAQLAAKFDLADMDGSGIISWTEFVAISLAISGTESSVAVLWAGNETTSTQNRSALLPTLQSEHCWRAFELLGDGSSLLTGSSLCKFTFPTVAHKSEACPCSGSLSDELKALDSIGGLSQQGVGALLGLGAAGTVDAQPSPM
mmetsp:Transcript_12872/g.29119  ORF Transcript_12872/g.29119 Transcript_12872/m.29119 type:complete len:506 (-) Transcript_12872:105-1622(-)